MITELVIETAQSSDIKEVVEIENESFCQPWSRESFERELQLKFSHFFVCRIKDNSNYKVAGYIIFWEIKDEGNIMNIAVKKEFQRRGLGKMLINHIITLAERKNLKEIYLEVREKNTIARALYESLGFKITRTRKNFYGDENGIVMAKKLKTFLLVLCLTLVMGKHLIAGPVGEISEQKYSSYLYYLQGLTYLKQNELEKAKIEFEKTIELDKNAVSAYKELISVYMQLGKPRSAQKLAEELKSISDDTNTKLFLGSFYVIIGDTTTAINEYKSVLEKEPDNAEAMIILAGIFSNIDPEKSLEYWEKYSKRNPNSSEALFRKALTLKKLKRTEEAKKTLEESIRINPSDILLHITMSEMLEEEQDYKSAADELMKCIEFVQDNFSFYVKAGGLYYLAKEHEKAEEVFKKVLTLAPDDVASKFWLALIYEDRKDWEKAIEILEKVVSKQPDVAGYIRLSYYYTQLGKTKKAVNLLKKAKKIDPKSPEVNFFLGLWFLEIKKYTEAEKCFLKTIDLNPELSDAHFYLGVIYEQTKKIEKSIPHFKRVIELDTKNATAMNYLGYSFADRNMKLDEAEELIRKALELDPENGAYIDSLGWVYFRQGRYEQAKEWLERAIEKLKDPVIYEHLGDLEKTLGNKSGAIEYYRKAIELDNKNKTLKKKLKSLE